MIHAADQFSQDVLRQAMNRAFADYAVPMQLAPGAFELMMRMRGLDPSLSRVALMDGAVVAFWLVGARARRGYLISSGTVPAVRRRGLSARIGRTVIEALRAAGYASLHAEVLEANHGARALYDRLGFAETRDLICYALRDTAALPEGPAIETRLGASVPAGADRLWDFAPSWQNDAPALQAAGEEAVVIDHHDSAGLAGYAAFVPAQASLAQVAIRPDRRREGLATALIAEGARRLGLPSLRVINVDSRAKPAHAFLEARQAQRSLSQKELLLPL